MWVSCVSAGILSDVFVQKKAMSPLNTRRFFNSIGNFGISLKLEYLVKTFYMFRHDYSSVTFSNYWFHELCRV
jgi:hypothetical protein